MANAKYEQQDIQSGPKSPVLDNNGILRCYNMFPTQFKTITEMTAYLSELQRMGFNAVWVNPIQTPGRVEKLFKRDKTNGVRAYNEVSGSLYAMAYPDMISPYVNPLPPNTSLHDKRDSDTHVMQQFTEEAQKNGLVPMFDLVLNHVAVDSPLRIQHPEWFEKEPHGDFRDAIAFTYKDPSIRHQIIEQFWKPYIHKYMVTYGFEGVRVDAVGYLHPELRKEIYAYIYDLADKYRKPKPVILDELLFSSRELETEVDKLLLPRKGPTHITRGTYYAKRDDYGGLPAWTKVEEGVKAQAVFLNNNKKPFPNPQGGCIAFTGNHDHNSLAMTIMLEMAEHRLANDQSMREAKQKFIEANKHLANEEAIESLFLYSYVKEIIGEIQTGKQKTIEALQKKMREKIAICALTSSGGWYALSGDETGDFLAKPVFRRLHAMDQTYYAQQTHKIFDKNHSNHTVAMAVLTSMAQEIANANSNNEPAGIAYNYFHNDLNTQNRLLVSFLETLQNQINCGDEVVCTLFQQKLQEKNITINFKKEDYIPAERTPKNGWFGQHNMKDFMAQINQLLANLPSSTLGFWSEVFPIPDKPNLVAVVRKNGMLIDSPTEIVIVNINPSKPVELTRKDIHTLACNFQKRVIPEYADEEKKHYNWQMGNVNFDLAYKTIMDCIDGKRIHVDQSITTNFPVENRYRMFADKKVSDPDMRKIETMSQEDTVSLELENAPEQQSTDQTMHPLSSTIIVKD
ncbi:alpha-amylase [Legionella sp. W05-934-2]|uniref:alpha-amylase n=1 Tax=Legionella sp. W05-934-2 TaxID=1198649 RepID=UPI003462CECC